jgi:hypothetical protein
VLKTGGVISTGSITVWFLSCNVIFFREMEIW